MWIFSEIFVHAEGLAHTLHGKELMRRASTTPIAAATNTTQTLETDNTKVMNWWIDASFGVYSDYMRESH
jgi:hypothetical protein